jgi:hypothetical protein
MNGRLQSSWRYSDTPRKIVGIKRRGRQLEHQLVELRDRPPVSIDGLLASTIGRIGPIYDVGKPACSFAHLSASEIPRLLTYPNDLAM